MKNAKRKAWWVVLGVSVYYIVKSLLPLHIYIPTGSMIPTYEAGDSDFIAKYRKDDVIQRKDIVVFNHPSGNLYIKRVIGLPGESVELTKNGEVLINGVALSESYLNEAIEAYKPQTFQVPVDCYFVMGDNRNNSYDSREWEDPFVHESKIVALKGFQ